MPGLDGVPGLDLSAVTADAAAFSARNVAGRVIVQPVGDCGRIAVLVGIEVIGVTDGALTGGGAEIGGAAYSGTGIEVVTVSARAGLAGGGGAVRLIPSNEGGGCGIMAVQAVVGGVAWSLRGEDAGRVVMLVARKIDVFGVARPTVTAIERNGFDVFPGGEFGQRW